MVRIRFIIGIFLFYSGILYADSIDDKIQQECKNDSPSNYFGTYIVDYYGKTSSYYNKEREKYISNKTLDKEYIIKKNLYIDPTWDFINSSNQLINPIYKIECIRIYKKEGNIQDKKYSYFYGFGTNRNYIKILKVYETEDDLASNDYSGSFEIDSTDELWDSHGYITLILKKFIKENS